jgi:glutamate dehydrogenase (NAD(P)+)
VVYTLREAIKHLGLDSTKTTAAIQGFGNVAQYAALGYSEDLGGKVVAVSCWDHAAKRSFSYVKPEGIDPRFLQSITDVYGTIDQEKAKKAGYQIEAEDAWLSQEVDILIPAALEAQINADNVGLVDPRVKLIAEGANGPTTPDAEKALIERGVFVIPDFLCNAGGVTVSYFEGVQNEMNFYWERDEVVTRLDQKMTNAFKAVLDTSQQYTVGMRDAAYIVAIDRVVRAMQFRGWL